MRWALVAVVLLAAACGGDSGSDDGLTVDGQRIPERRLIAAVEGLCEARAAAGGDLTAARAAFYDRSHEMLHTIASALEPVDRPQAARLLEAKQEVEAGLAAQGPSGPSEREAPPPPSDLGADLDRLTVVTRAGLDRLGVETSACS